jgi:hypothetical protein
MLAEDLNVAFPISYWAVRAFAPPEPSHSESAEAAQSMMPKPVFADKTHVFYPFNTEYEITKVDGKGHTLGALFVLNHRSRLVEGVPPLKPMVERVRREGALLELDKHNWPWSMMLVPTLRVDLYELANNHIWRTVFAVRKWAEQPPPYMKAEVDEDGMTERGWIDFGFQNYYALLNCGFRLRPTAGTASGVHPVPLGFGRVYVHLAEPFGYDAWVRGLSAGRSFVTTGPMLFVTVDGQEPGHTFKVGAGPRSIRLQGTAESAPPLERIEVVVNGLVARAIRPENRPSGKNGYVSRIDETLPVEGSSWIAVRAYEDRPDRRPRFAHSAPFFVDVDGVPLRPRREEVEYLIKRVEEQITRSSPVLPAAAIEEYRVALEAYRQIAKTAR